MRFALPAVVSTSLLLLSAASAHANAPAPWFACEGKAVGDACDRYGWTNGTCVSETGCTDNPATAVDECLICLAKGNGCSVVSGPGALVGSGGLLVLAAFAMRRRRG